MLKSHWPTHLLNVVYPHSVRAWCRPRTCTGQDNLGLEFGLTELYAGSVGEDGLATSRHQRGNYITVRPTDGY